MIKSSGPAGVIVSILALVVATAGVAEAVSPKSPSLKPRPYGVLALNKKKKFPASVIPKVRSARNADRLGGKRLSALNDGCAADSVDMGTYCLQASPFALLAEDEGKNNFFFATKKCASIGGWVPSAGELIGAADRIKIASTIDDSPTTASIDEDPSDGLKDRREMTSTLVTTAAGSAAAGTQGVTAGSRGDSTQGEPDPVPLAANPQPETLQYVTVYDNRNAGGFAGAKPVGQAERFRCAFSQSQARSQRKVED
ncbi:MAG: hypothetical protein WAO61_05700 [Solirubrobacterales bacterium]